jgi:MtN3 and saliva related transmembrane protein
VSLAIGLFAASLTIASFLAQSWKILKSRDVRSLSAPMWILSVVAFAVWSAYGILEAEWPIIVPNVVCFLLAGFILALKLMPRHHREAVAEAVTGS